MKVGRAKNYFDKNGYIYGVSQKYAFGKWDNRLYRFRDWESAQKWLYTEEYDFRERELITKTTARNLGYKES